MSTKKSPKKKEQAKPEETLDSLMQKFYYDLIKGADLEPPPIEQLSATPDVVLLALEEMLGIDNGGMMLGEALKEWLAKPKTERRKVNFEDLMIERRKMVAEIEAMVEADEKEWKAWGY